MNKLLKIMPLVVLAPFGCNDDIILTEVYHGSKDNNGTITTPDPFPLKVGDKFLYRWLIQKKEDCLSGGSNEQNLQIYQCATITKIDESGSEVKVTSKTRFIFNYPQNVGEDQYHAMGTLFKPVWHFLMLPESINDFGNDKEMVYYTQKTPRPYADLGGDGLDFRAMQITELRPIGTTWNGWETSNNAHSFRTDFSSYFVENYQKASPYFTVQRTDPFIYKAGFTWRELVNEDAALHGLYFEYDHRGALSFGEEIILFDNGETSELPNALDIMGQACNYNGSYFVQVASDDMDYYWEKFCN